MKPVLDLRISGGPSSATANDRLISLRLEDEAGEKSDLLELVFDDRAPHIALPPKGVEIDVALGFGTAVSLGTFTVDGVSASATPARTVTVSAKPVSMAASIKEPRTRTWSAPTLRTIVETIAAEHGLEPALVADLANYAYPHLVQAGESDLNLLTRLARQHDAVAKPKDGRLLFYRRGDNDPGSVITLTAEDFATWDWKNDDRPLYNRCIAWWRDFDLGIRRKIELGSGEPVIELRHTYQSEGVARSAAETELRSSNRQEGSFIGRLAHGNPYLRAERRINVSGLRDGPDGLWMLTRVSHGYTRRGFTTRFEAEKPSAPS